MNIPYLVETMAGAIKSTLTEQEVKDLYIIEKADGNARGTFEEFIKEKFTPAYDKDSNLLGYERE